jgi:Ni/Fe-hydrogenase 1 B-type cytochrome subunit
MATSRVATGNDDYSSDVYVFEVPVRIWHWIHALAITALAITGYLIANPLPSVSGEASDSFLMGNIRLIHFSAAMVFAVGLFVRFYWAIVGNRYAKGLLVVPVWRGEFWKRLFHEVLMYSFLTRKVAKYRGHNPLAQLAMWLFNVVLALFMVCTGFALYSQGTGAGSWADRWFGWVFVIEPSSQAVRMWHLLGMWLMVFFVIVHIYMVVRAEFMSRQNGISVMIDEGFGIRAVEALNARYAFPDDVRLMDGGTQGIFLLPWVCSAKRLLIFDAVDFGMEPAALRMVQGEEVPCFMGAKKVSMHQAGFQEVLSSATLSGSLPEELVLIGVQPELLNDYGGSLTSGVKARIPEAVALACEVLRGWDIDVRERDRPLEGAEKIGPGALDIRDYEEGRPRLEGEVR